MAHNGAQIGANAACALLPCCQHPYKLNIMKVKDLIKSLQKQDPEKEVMIQQGEEFDYMSVHTVKEMYVDVDDEEMILSVVIEYC